MKMTRMSFREITPNVRHVNLLECVPGFLEGPRKIYDHQFLYVHRGAGVVEINGERFEAIPGDFFYYGPAVTHSILADDRNPFVLSGIHFDYTYHFKEAQFPIGPFKPEYFNPDLVTERVEFTDFCGFYSRINLHGDLRVAELVNQMVKEYNDRLIYNDNCLNGLFLTLLSTVARHTAARENGVEAREGIVDQVIRYIHRNYDYDLTNESIGEHFHFHPNYLNQLMVAHTGISLRQYLIDFRIKKALHLILNTDASISEISRKVGYSDLHYFSRLFKQRVGYSPSTIKRCL